MTDMNKHEELTQQLFNLAQRGVWPSKLLSDNYPGKSGFSCSTGIGDLPEPVTQMFFMLSSSGDDNQGMKNILDTVAYPLHTYLFDLYAYALEATNMNNGRMKVFNEFQTRSAFLNFVAQSYTNTPKIENTTERPEIFTKQNGEEIFGSNPAYPAVHAFHMVTGVEWLVDQFEIKDEEVIEELRRSVYLLSMIPVMAGVDYAGCVIRTLKQSPLFQDQ